MDSTEIFSFGWVKVTKIWRIFFICKNRGIIFYKNHEDIKMIDFLYVWKVSMLC